MAMTKEEIIISSNPKGQILEGTISGAILPGTICRVKATPFINGEPVFEPAAPGTDGKSVTFAVLMEDKLQGKRASDAYVDGTRCTLYCPVQGEIVNVRCGEVAGTGNSFAIGDRLIVDAEDGILVPETGTPQDTVAVVMETVTQAAGSVLVAVQYMG